MLFILTIVMCAVVYTTNNIFFIGTGMSGNPFDICRMCGVRPFMCSSQNISGLTDMMRRCKVSAVAVGGWNGVEGDLVLRDNGNVAPYDPYTNSARYFVFCGSLSDAERLANYSTTRLKILSCNRNEQIPHSVHYDQPRMGMTSEATDHCGSQCSLNTEQHGHHHKHHHDHHGHHHGHYCHC